MKDKITSAGGKVSSSVTKSVTTLLSDGEESAKYKKAVTMGVEIVDEKWLQGKVSGKKGKKAPKAKPAAKTTETKAKAPKKGQKRAKEEVEAVEEEVEEKPAAKKAKTAPKTKAAPKAKGAKSQAKEEKPLSEVKAKRTVDPRCAIADSAEVHEDFDCTLNQTNIANNNNKFYIIQLLRQPNGDYWVWNRWGRVGEPGQNSLKNCGSLDAAVSQFKKKFQDKTKNNWDDRANFEAVPGKYTLIKMKEKVEKAEEVKEKKVQAKSAAALKKDSKLQSEVYDLVQYLFQEATGTLKQKVDCEIDEDGIHTPLGVLDTEQVKAGEAILEQIHAVVEGEVKGDLKDLSSKYYTAIPHKFGRCVPPVINNTMMIKQESELLELMGDMVAVSKGRKNVLVTENIDEKYDSLDCKIEYVPNKDPEFDHVVKSIAESEKRSKNRGQVKVKNVFKVKRECEHQAYKDNVGNEQSLYHGSRIANWVGLLSRGILLPKVVVSMGVKRTDAGWLGSGIYFGDADTAKQYAGRSKRAGNTGFMLMFTVSLGKVKDYSTITYGLTGPPKGYDSCHGVMGTQFDDHEYVVYEEGRQKMEYFVEFTAQGTGQFASS
eukprot:GCRY01000418.1.p1 GENE.GCRY01000418.1~~GCRY01000418.1.p1  ORF type:complete len:663 (+),score=179.34 GCRY01000418.1:190-1989(+)